MAMISVDAAYARWAPHYPPTAHNALMHVEEAAVVSLLPSMAGAVALDAACGTGRYSRILNDCGASRVISVDRSQPMIARANGRARVLGNLLHLPIGAASVDVAVCGLALNDVAALGDAVAELARVLKPGGVLVYSTLHPRGAVSRWTRTFEADGRTWSLPVCWHSVSEHQRACRDARLTIDHQLEPELENGGGAVALVIRASRT